MNFVLVGVFFVNWNEMFQFRTVSVCRFGVVLSLTHTYSTNIIQIQDKLIIKYTIQTQCQTNIILKFKIFLNSQD